MQFLFVLLGWSATSFAWAMVGVVVCLPSNAPDPAAMTKSALIGLPTAAVLGRITKFLILGGTDVFPLFMIGTAPALFVMLLVTSSPNPALSGAGLLAAVYTIVVVVSPSNPQSYVVTAILFLIVALLASVLLRVLTGSARSPL